MLCETYAFSTRSGARSSPPSGTGAVANAARRAKLVVHAVASWKSRYDIPRARSRPSRVETNTTRSGRSIGSPRRTMALMKVNIIVLVPMPMASASTATTAR